MKQVRDWSNRLRIEHLWVLAVLAGVFMFVNTHPIRPNDFWFHIATGREILQTGHIPQVDTFSYTNFGAPYLSNNIYWLMQIALYGVYSVGGAAWVILFASISITTAYGLLTWMGLKSTGNWRAAAVGILFAAALGIDNWNVRPQVAAYLFAAVCLVAIQAYRLGGSRRWLGIYPIVMFLWVSSHGTFFIGLVLIAFLAADLAWQVFLDWKQTKRWDFRRLVAPVIVGAASGLVCLFNPLGFGIVRYLTNMSVSPVTQGLILEWQPPNFGAPGGILFLVLLVSAGVLLILSSSLPRPTTHTGSANAPLSQKEISFKLISLWERGRGEGSRERNPRQVDFFSVLCFLFFGLLGLRYNRAVVWFGFMLAPVVASGVSGLLERFGSRSGAQPVPRAAKAMNLGLLLVLGTLAFLSLPWLNPCGRLFRRKRACWRTIPPSGPPNSCWRKSCPRPYLQI